MLRNTSVCYSLGPAVTHYQFLIDVLIRDLNNSITTILHRLARGGSTQAIVESIRDYALLPGYNLRVPYLART